MLFTDPSHVALPILLLPFLLIGFLVNQTSKLVIKFAKIKQSTASRLIPILLAFSVVAVMVLSSLHQLTWKDTVLILVFGILFALYIVRADFLK
ncbi:MAG TPA: hypothetical protein VLF79_04330 [Candidatus Saccharimonadales bacterium]|nr:hypothetical protein [Candidatus Saccharimonadales bacterium]